MATHGVRYSTVAAILLAPVVASAAVSGASWFVLAGLRASEWGIARAVFLIALLLAVPVTVLVGPFAFAFMQKRNWRQWYHYLWAGAVVALGATALLVLYAASSGQLQPIVAAFLSMWAVPIGVITALVGWTIRRPDRDHHPASSPS